MELGKSKREKDVRKVASVACFNEDGLLLFGQRSDSGKWTLPGGHLEPGETPLEAAQRELKEEAGIEGKNFRYLGRGAVNGGGLVVYSYECDGEGEPDPSADPDEECDTWRWTEPLDLPAEISNNLHAPRNVTLRLLGLQDGDVEEPMDKSEPREFRSQDGLRIPAMADPGRKSWDKKYHERLVDTFAGGDIHRLRPLKIPVSEHLGGHFVQGAVGPGGRDRRGFYRRMMRAGDRVPPIVVRRSGQGWHVIDGNARVHAALATKLPELEAYELLDPPQKGLAKGLRGPLVAAMLAGSTPAMGGAPEAPKAAPAPQAYQWSPEGLSHELHPIAQLESNFGQNVNHAPHSGGEYHTAYGALGFKPSTAHEEYKRSKFLQDKFPGLTDPSDFIKVFKVNPKFYNLLASAHWSRLAGRHGGDVNRAAYAWRWGAHAAQNATHEQIENDSYVQKYKHMALHQLQPQPEPVAMAKSDPDDPIDAMLDHDDPRERILALKHARVTPYHIRRALNDEDPTVREFAVKHPKLSEPLLIEALKHHDSAVKLAALQRPDLQDKHLELVLFDPDLQVHVARHPAITEDQKRRMADHLATPHGLKEELLSKNIGLLDYPNLKVPRPSGPMTYDDKGFKKWLRTRSAIYRGMTGEKKFPIKQSATGGLVLGNAATKPQYVEDIKNKLHTSAAVNMGRPQTTQRVKIPSNLDVALGIAPAFQPKQQEQFPDKAHDKDAVSRYSHENQHMMYNAIRQRHSWEVGNKVVDHTLAALDKDDYRLLNRITGHKVRHYHIDQQPEEKIAYLHSYLMSPIFRAEAHRAMGVAGDKNNEKLVHDWAKRIWQKLRARSAATTPEDVGIRRKSEDERIGEWMALNKVQDDKDYNVYEDMLGLDNRAWKMIRAAEFLAHHDADLDVFREALVRTDEVEMAALEAVGMDPTDENKRALDAVVSVQELDKSEALVMPHTIQACMPDGEAVADGIRRGFSAGTEKPLKLGGKHSAGAMAVRDPRTQQQYLIKPGSGKQSPAAGARQDPASQSRREAAFWHVAQMWGIGIRFPRADLMLIDGKEIAALHLLPPDWLNLEKIRGKNPGMVNTSMPGHILDRFRLSGELHRWAVIDFVLGNPDRHGQNIMVGPARDEYPVALIDHGSAFAGSQFDPANDKNSFVPYYLRAWQPNDWATLDLKQKLQSMPVLSDDRDEDLRNWIERLHADDLETILHRFGIDPKASCARLAKVKSLLAADNISAAINKLWIIT